MRDSSSPQRVSFFWNSDANAIDFICLWHTQQLSLYFRCVGSSSSSLFNEAAASCSSGQQQWESYFLPPLSSFFLLGTAKKGEMWKERRLNGFPNQFLFPSSSFSGVIYGLEKWEYAWARDKKSKGILYRRKVKWTFPWGLFKSKTLPRQGRGRKSFNILDERPLLGLGEVALLPTILSDGRLQRREAKKCLAKP